jgi:hypothetical protein
MLLPALVLATVLGLLVTPLALKRRPSTSPSGGTTAARPPHAEQGAREAFGRVPLSFEANGGQTESSVDFLARGAGYALFLKSSEAVFVLRNADAASPTDESRRVLNPQSDLRVPQSGNQQSAISNQQSKVLRMRLVGAREGAAAAGENELEGRANYMLGQDPERWRTNVAT